MEFLPSLYVSFWTWAYTENDIHLEELNSQKDFPQITDLNYAFIHILSMRFCVCVFRCIHKRCNGYGKWMSKGKKIIILFIDSLNTESSSSSVWEAHVMQNKG